MNTPANQPKTTPASVTMFRIFLIATILMSALLGGVIYWNKTVHIISGKVIDITNETEFSSRKNSYQQEFAIIEYSVSNQQHTGKAAVPRKKHSERGSLVPTYYYPQFPQFAWFYSKENGLSVLLGFLLVISLSGLAISSSAMQKRKAVSTGSSKTAGLKASKQSQPNPGQKKS
jgi:hypothetical protein